MRTTVRLDQGLLDHARHEAERRGTTLTPLIEERLRLEIRPRPAIDRRSRISLPVSPARSGLIAGVDPDDSAVLLDQMVGVGSS